MTWEQPWELEQFLELAVGLVVAQLYFVCSVEQELEQFLELAVGLVVVQFFVEQELIWEQLVG